MGMTALCFQEPGLYPVRVVSQGKGELARGQVLVGNRYSSPLGVILKRCARDEEQQKLALSLGVYYNWHPHQGGLQLDLLFLRSKRQSGALPPGTPNR